MSVEFRGRVFLAPLTKGGNLPFRRLCVAHGCDATMGEMAYARQIVRKSRSERALLRRHADETCFGVQLAAQKPDEAVAAGRIAVEYGAQWIDINCGCPIHDVVRRGMGAVLMQKPNALGRLVEAMARELPVPVTVKLRLGWSESTQNVSEVARIAEESGAAAIAVHGRTREQRYSRSADWQAVAQVASERSVPVIGNGDLLTYYETERLWQQSGVASVMLGRGALIKPWLFREIAERRSIEPTAEERLAIYVEFVRYLKEHFRDDDKGRERALRFLPWHLGFFCRYRPFPRERFEAQSIEHPLLQTRRDDDADDGELSVLERLLRDPREAVHARLAEVLWGAGDVEAAIAAALVLAAEMPPESGEAAEIATAHG
ncbi:MAG: tRNA-dihydrouridine synthase family protein [Planctomycetes bacterium]|nr:tRNA-dihydrouridine synthase family protein [Planctomycetota bacterium]